MHHLDQAGADRQPESRAAIRPCGRAIGLGERLEYDLLFLLARNSLFARLPCSAASLASRKISPARLRSVMSMNVTTAPMATLPLWMGRDQSSTGKIVPSLRHRTSSSA